MIPYSLPFLPMRSVKSAALAAVAAVALCACGSAVKPPQGRGQIDDPRTKNPNHVACLRQHGLPVQEVGATGLRFGSAPGAPTVAFEPTPGAAQDMQISGQSEGAEVIGSALLYPHQASEAELGVIETCLGHGVTG